MIKSINNKTKKEGFVNFTHANNSGQITTFFYSGGKACCSPRSFNLKDFGSVIDFLKSEYPNFTFIEVE